MTERTARDARANYRAELEQRFGVRPALCEMDAIGYSADKRKPYEMAEGVAIIDISGVLTNDAWWWDETEYGDIQREVRMALEDSDVTAILLRVNSPGGETDNAFETADVIAEAGKKKPLWAAADNIAYSAGYLLASSASRIYVAAKSGGVGSIGVYSAHFDYSKALEKMGINVTLISAGKGKTDGNPYEPLSDAAKKKIRAEVDRLYGLFVGSVARGRRGLSEESVREMGAALCNGAEAAIAAKLADKSGSVEDAWVDLVEFTQAQQQKSFGMSASAGMNPRKEVGMADTHKPADEKKPPEQAAEAVADNAKLVAEARAAGFAEAQEIVELCSLAGQPAKAAAFIGERKSAADVRKTLLDERARSGEEGGEINNASMPGTAASKDKPKQSLAERMKAQLGKGVA